jgi:hypothetical protein
MKLFANPAAQQVSFAEKSFQPLASGRGFLYACFRLAAT